MKIKQRRIEDFEKHSVALFSALLVGVALAAPVRAQTQAAPNTARGAPVTTQQGTRTSETGRTRLSTAQVQQAFGHIDSNGDGSLSRAEISVYPRIEKHFDRIDANRDGTVSPDEFSQALQHVS